MTYHKGSTLRKNKILQFLSIYLLIRCFLFLTIKYYIYIRTLKRILKRLFK